uniref:DDE_Tnp_1_7 domain-containing protein n=1 Tax=Strongyloides papillosus TaxID=174720 RepID=A0A0N5BEP7_STREA
MNSKDFNDLSFEKLSLGSGGDYDDEEDDGNVDDNFFYENESFYSVSGEDESKDTLNSWSHNITKPSRWKFRDPKSCLNKNLVSKCKTPSDYYNLFFDDEMIDFIVQETNRYGPTKDSAFIPTDEVEIRKFLAVIIQMEYVRLPKLKDYWSSDPAIGGHAICSSVMPRSRCKTLFRPGENVCIDESLVPYRGRISFRQYIPSKRYSYGIKIFKICSQHGYTHNMIIYAGKQDQPRKGTVAEDVVLKLLDDLLGHGRTLYTDNWYTSVPLARTLIKNKTNLVGTIRKNRASLPKSVTSLKLKKGQQVAAQTNDGILVLKWHDKRDVLMLSTTHDDLIDENGKPRVILDYDVGKAYVDISDQMASYSPYIRKTIKWYLRILFFVVIQAAVVNA